MRFRVRQSAHSLLSVSDVPLQKSQNLFACRLAVNPLNSGLRRGLVISKLHQQTGKTECCDKSECGCQNFRSHSKPIIAQMNRKENVFYEK